MIILKNNNNQLLFFHYADETMYLKQTEAYTAV